MHNSMMQVLLIKKFAYIMAANNFCLLKELNIENAYLIE